MSSECALCGNDTISPEVALCSDCEALPTVMAAETEGATT